MIEIVTLRRRLLGCAASCVLATSAAGAPSVPLLAVDIAPQPLNQALAAFGEQTGLQLFYVSAIAKTRSSKGARAGSHPPRHSVRYLRARVLSSSSSMTGQCGFFPHPIPCPRTRPHCPPRHILPCGQWFLVLSGSKK
jgi:hypothetical protein